MNILLIIRKYLIYGPCGPEAFLTTIGVVVDFGLLNHRSCVAGYDELSKALTDLDGVVAMSEVVHVHKYLASVVAVNYAGADVEVVRERQPGTSYNPSEGVIR